MFPHVVVNVIRIFHCFHCFHCFHYVLRFLNTLPSNIAILLASGTPALTFRRLRSTYPTFVLDSNVPASAPNTSPRFLGVHGHQIRIPPPETLFFRYSRSLILPSRVAWVILLINSFSLVMEVQFSICIKRYALGAWICQATDWCNSTACSRAS